MEQTQNAIAERAGGQGLDHAIVWGYIHRNNSSSIALVDRHHFFYARDDGEYQEWWSRIDIADPGEINLV